MAEIWSRSSQDGNKQFQVAFCWYLEYFLKYEIFLVKIYTKKGKILQNFSIFCGKIAISQEIFQISTKSYLELFVTILRWSWPNFSQIAPFFIELNRFAWNTRKSRFCVKNPIFSLKRIFFQFFLFSKWLINQNY